MARARRPYSDSHYNEPTDPQPTEPAPEPPPDTAGEYLVPIADPQPHARTARSYRVPASLAPRRREEEHVTCTSLEAAQHNDARLWRRGWPW